VEYVVRGYDVGALAADRMAPWSISSSSPSGRFFGEKGQSMMLLVKTSYRVFSAIEIMIVFFVIALLLGCALFDTMLLRKPSHRPREIAEI